MIPLQCRVRGQPFWRGRPRSQLAFPTPTDSSKPLTLGDLLISNGTFATDQPLTKRNRRQLADPAYPPSALVVNATGDQDIEASDRQDLLGLLRLGQPLTILTLTILATTFWGLLRFEIAELNSTRQPAIATPPVRPLAKSLFSIAAELIIREKLSAYLPYMGD